MGKNQVKAERGKRVPGVDPEALHKILYSPHPIEYQGSPFKRHQLIALREKLVHVAQEVLQQGPEAKNRISPENLMATIASHQQSRRALLRPLVRALVDSLAPE